MRLVIARMNHETNTFSPVPTPLSSFEPRWGADVLAAARGSQTAMGAFLDFASAIGAEIETPVFATAFPSGPVDDAAFEAMSAAIVTAAEKGCDAVLLDLHGAMVTQAHEDGEGELLERLRRVVGSLPIGVALDMHANISARMVEMADAIVGFRTYPHVDMYDTGERTAVLIRPLLEGGRKPAMAWRQLPLLAHTLCMNTGVAGAMRDAVDAARAVEGREGVLSASVFGGFSLADIRDAGLSVVVVADGRDLAEATADELAARIWTRRDEFVYREVPLRQSVAEARRAAERPGKGPVLLLDHGDNCMSGGTCDTMDVLAEALNQGLEDILVGPIRDPRAVAELAAAGEGAQVTLGIGHRTPMPLLEAAPRPPLTLSGTVRTIGQGTYVISGPTYTGMRCDMGKSVVLDTGAALVVICERTHEPWDLGVFTCLGLDPSAHSFLILKSRMYCRPVFEPLSRAVIECASMGVTSSDYSLFRFRRLRRPIYPLDEEIRWQPIMQTA
ncbi:M81 family metallopeptidase [Rhodoligotrophos defluvii]|uniref:M81 family metallopeptidase n=1 Tax=Rhodoligotrophos defluvii TaxID=2561934 RepID=UPI0010C9605E|nr:M81 family metallopeptidase [Rhodoligotrophos defluvii]